MTTEQKNRIVSLRQAGYGYTAVAREVGITKSAVCKYCHQIGLAEVGNDLINKEDRGNVGGKQKPETKACKVTHHFTDDCTDFSTNGNGTIEPTSALVTEALNGEYELQLVHPDDRKALWSIIYKATFSFGNRYEAFLCFRQRFCNGQIIGVCFPASGSATLHIGAPYARTFCP